MQSIDAVRQKPGRPKTGRKAASEYKAALIDSGGRVMQLRLTEPSNSALKALQEAGEFSSATEAIGAAIVEAAKKRSLIK